MLDCGLCWNFDKHADYVHYYDFFFEIRLIFFHDLTKYPICIHHHGSPQDTTKYSIHAHIVALKNMNRAFSLRKRVIDKQSKSSGTINR